tara:strand:- start:1211 stop:1396 length:186 start_codon:yes stop_codon:yes gene_type:complete
MKNKNLQYWIEFISWSLFCAALGFIFAGHLYNSAIDKVILDLKLERTQLEVKILKKECNDE